MKHLTVLLILCFAVSVTAQDRHHRRQPDPWTYGSDNTWNPSWDQRPHPARGACFFSTAPFRGHVFCVRRGDRLPSLPGNFGDDISSIQVYGGARVRIFNDRNFRGGSTMIGRSVDDLRRVHFRGGHTWNNRISSVMVF